MRVLGSLLDVFKLIFKRSGRDITVQPNASTSWGGNRVFNLPDSDADTDLLGVAAAEVAVLNTLPRFTNINANVLGATGVSIDNSDNMTVPGNIIVTGTVDGVDVSAHNTATTNVHGAGANTLIHSGNKLSALSATTSAELAGVISDETGSGSLVFATSPTLVTPTLGVASATSLEVTGGTAGAKKIAYAGSAIDINDSKLTVADTGAVTLGVTDKSAQHTIYGQTVIVDNSDNVLVIRSDLSSGTNRNMILFQLDGSTATQSGGIYANNIGVSPGFFTSSDARLKTNIKEYRESDLCKIASLEIKTFDIGDNKHQKGIIAQDLQKVYPEKVMTQEDGFLSVSLDYTYEFIKAIQELNAKIEALEARLN